MRALAESGEHGLLELVMATHAGNTIETNYEPRDGKPTLVRMPEMSFIDDKAGKPVAINQHIGPRPIVAFGNSDGDFEMLEWTTAGAGARLGLIMHHDDAEREYAYDRTSAMGGLDRGSTKRSVAAGSSSA